MNTFEVGTRVRVTPEYAKDWKSTEEIENLRGAEGVVAADSLYVEVRLDGHTHNDGDNLWHFLPDELEAV